MEKLPTKNTVIQDFINRYNLVIDKSRSVDNCVYIRSSICTVDDAQSFVKNFSKKTQSAWNVYTGDSLYRAQRLVFHKSWVCHRGPQKHRYKRTKNLDCEAQLDVKVKKNNRHTAKNDTFLHMSPPLPCVIKLKNKHNHRLEEDTKYLRVSDEVKDLFYGYFDNGIGVAKALKLHEENLQSIDSLRRSPRLLPRAKQVYHLYKLWQQKKRVAGVVCEDMEELLETIDVEELISTIPRIEPPPKKAKVPAPPSVKIPILPPVKNIKLPPFPVKTPSLPSLTPAKNPTLSPFPPEKIQALPPFPSAKNPSLPSSNVQIGTKCQTTIQPQILPQSVINTQAAPNLPSASNPRIIPTFMPQIQNLIQSRIGNIGPNIRKIIVVNRPVSNQNMALNTSSHLNGSIYTVMNSRSGAPVISSFGNTQASSDVIPQLSTVMSLGSGHSDLSSVLNSEKSVSSNKRVQERLEPCSILPNIYDQEIMEEDLSKKLQSDDTESFVASNTEHTVSNSFGSPATSQECETDAIISASQVCCPVFLDTNSNSMESSIYELTNQDTSTFSGMLRPKSTDNLIDGNQDTFEIFDSGGHEDECFSSSVDTQILTNSSNQSEIQISVKSLHEPTEMDNLDDMQLSVSHSNGQSSSEEPVKIKEEPPDDYEINNAMDFQTSSALLPAPNASLSNDTTISHLKIEVVDEDDIDSLETGNFLHTDNVSQPPTAIIEDEDQQFLMSLLPEFRRIPRDSKVMLKSQIQNLILTARLSSCRKRTEVKNNMYRDYRTFPSFPTFK